MKIWTALLLWSVVHIASAQIDCSNLTDCPILNGGNCPPVAVPEINPDCFGSLEKYLAHTYDMCNLVGFNTLPNTWNGCFDENDILTCPDADGNIPCDNVWAYKGQPYCPERYCDQISFLVEQKATLLRRVAGLWGSEAQHAPGHDYYEKTCQTVCDINAAFDCADLPRPIIGAAIFELITDNVEYVKIPEEILLAFFDTNGNSTIDASEMSQAGISYYYEPNGMRRPTQGQKFVQSRIGFTDTMNDPLWSNDDNTMTPDVTKIEARMWMYYLSKRFMDCGYTNIHFGQMMKMGRDDVGNVATHELFTMIRDYAESIGALVTIDAHISTNDKLKLGGSLGNQLLYDFVTFPILVDELDNSPGIYAGTACDNPSDESLLVDLDFSFNTHPSPEENLTGGILPNGCEMDEISFVAVLDHADGTCNDVSEWYCTWGFDHATWFSQISEGCQALLLENLYCGIRNEYNHGFLSMPGIRPWKITNQNQDFFMMSESGDLAENVAESLEPVLLTEEDVTITSRCVRTLSSGWEPHCTNFGCDKPAPPGYLWSMGRNLVTIKVNQVDCSSFISIHVKGPNGWIPHKVGTEYSFYVPVEGQYNITIDQFNQSLDPSVDPNRNGTYLLHMPTEWLSDECCELVPKQYCEPIFCVNRPKFITNCYAENEIKWDYNIEMFFDNSDHFVESIESLNEGATFENITLDAQNVLKGQMSILKASPVLNMAVKTSQDLVDCDLADVFIIEENFEVCDCPTSNTDCIPIIYLLSNSLYSCDITYEVNDTTCNYIPYWVDPLGNEHYEQTIQNITTEGMWYLYAEGYCDTPVDSILLEDCGYELCDNINASASGDGNWSDSFTSNGTGVVNLVFDAKSVPDRLVAVLNGVTIVDSGNYSSDNCSTSAGVCVGNVVPGCGNDFSVDIAIEHNDVLDLFVYGNTCLLGGTQWILEAFCDTDPFTARKSANNDSQEGGYLDYYPNPATDVITIETIRELTPNAISIMNNTGKEISKITNIGTSNVIDVSKIPPGIYYFIAHYDGFTDIQSIAIIR